jgi:hypothetical protein
MTVTSCVPPAALLLPMPLLSARTRRSAADKRENSPKLRQHHPKELRGEDGVDRSVR